MERGISKSFTPIFSKLILLIFLVFNLSSVCAQQSKIDSLKNLIAIAKSDTTKILLYEKLGDTYYDEKKNDSSFFSFKQALEINEKGNYWPQRQCWETAAIDYRLYEMGNYSESLKYASKHLTLSENLNDTFQKGFAHLVFGHDYRELGEYRLSLDHYFKAKEFFKLFWVTRGYREDNTYTMLCISETYLKKNNLDSALVYVKMAHKIAVAISDGNAILSSTRIFGNINFAKGNNEAALSYYRQYVPDFVKNKERNRDLGFVLNSMAEIFRKTGQKDSLMIYAKKAFSYARQYSDQENIHTAAMLLADYYTSKDEHEAFNYFKIATQAKDSMMNTEKLKQVQILSYNNQVREKEKLEANAKEAARRRLITITGSILVLIISFLIWNRLRQLRLKYKMVMEQKEVEKLKAKHEKELLELEAKALRAQMNPHFIFNCMNSIKSLMQQQNNDRAIRYLTTFSKLIRTIFQNSDKREITLFDEIETCRFYTQLESMRFADKFNYQFNIDQTTDLKSVQVPALIIQPFIENAIWHGLMPKDEGGMLTVSIAKGKDAVLCVIEDDGIGRDMSKQNRFKAEQSSHESKGVHLTQSRLDLDNVLNKRNASVEIIDKIDEEGRPAGTKIVLSFKEY